MSASEIGESNQAGAHGDHTVYFGGLISLFGFLFLIYTLSSILWPQVFEGTTTGPSEGDGWRWKAVAFMAAVALTIAALFSLFNFNLAEQRGSFSKLSWAIPYRAYLLSIATIGAVLSILLVAQILDEDHRHTASTQKSFYFLKLANPVIDKTIDAEKDGKETAGSGIDQTTSPDSVPNNNQKKKIATASSVPTTLQWTVPAYEQNHHDGILLMALSALLVVGFGIIYRHLSLSGGDKHGIGLLEKMIVPILSTLAFGAGVAENSEAKQMNADVKLAREGGVKIYDMGKKERQAYLAALDRFSNAGRRDLVASLDRLGERIAAKKFEFAFGGEGREKDAGRENLLEQIAMLQNQIANHGHKLPTIQVEDFDFKGLEQAMTNNNNAVVGKLGAINQSIGDNVTATRNISNKLVAMDKNLQKQTCRLAKTLSMNDQNRSKRALTAAERREELKQRDIFEQIWFGMKGESRGERSRMTKGESHIAELKMATISEADIRQIGRQCGEIQNLASLLSR